MTSFNYQLSGNTAIFVGELTRDTVGQLKKKDIKKLISTEQLTLDLQQLTRTDTAGLAWLLLLVEKSQQAKCQLKFINFPNNLHKLAQLSGVDSFIPI